MTAELPSPQTTLVILLGASQWPYAPDFHPSEAFRNSIGGLKSYLLDPSKFNLPSENALDLFDSEQSPSDLDQEMSDFIDEGIVRLSKSGQSA